MNYTRALFTSIIFYVLIAIGAILLLEFSPFSYTSGMFHVFMGLLFIPFTLVAAKWYFRKDSPPTAMKGLFLGIIVLVFVTIFDILLRVPQDMAGSLTAFYLDWRVIVEYLFILFLFAYFGFEFDDVYTQDVKKV